MSVLSEDVDRVDALIRSTAKRVTWDFPGIDHEDIAQSLWEKYLEAGWDADDEGLRGALFKLGKSLAWDIRREQLQQSAQYSYRTEDVKIILETAFDIQDWMSGYVPRDAGANGEKDAMAPLEVRVDAMIAYRQLSSGHRDAICSRYAWGVPPEDPRALSRAIKALADIMNSYQGTHFNRTVMSNAQARYLLENQS